MTKRVKPGVSVVLTAHNEERRLPAWFEKIAWADEVIVVDSGSTDRTPEIARLHTNKVFKATNKLNFDINKSIGIQKASREWVLVLDADEFPAEELAANIQLVAKDTACPYDGFTIRRRNFVMGYEIPGLDYQLRLFRKGHGKLPEKTVHEAITVKGVVVTLPGELLHYTEDSIFQRVEKSNHYSEVVAAHWYESRKAFHLTDMLLQPFVHFVKSYVVQRGYTLGVFGLIWSVNVAYSMFLRYAKLWSAYKLGRFRSPSDEFPSY